MSRFKWRGNRVILWLAIILVPPLGLILAWMNRDSRIPARVLQSIAALAAGVLHLQLFWGMHMEVDGGARSLIITFQNERRHMAEIERRHTAERSIDTSLEPIPPEIPAAPQPDTTGSRPAPVEKAPSPRPYWTEFRGPDRLGVYSETAISTDWPSGRLPLLWKRPVGGGYASVAIADGLVFTIEQRKKREVVAAYDLDSGQERWIHGWDAEFTETMGGDGPRATPTWNGGRLYALGATGALRCLDARSGRLIWSRNILEDNQAQNLRWGMSASPLVVGSKVIVLPGGVEGKSVVAYDTVTGNPIWKALSDRQAYTSPQLATLAGRTQLLIVSARRAMGLTIEDGALLWEYPWVTDNDVNSAQPIVTADNRFFISAGYGHGAALIEIIPKDGAYEARAVWQTTRMKNKFSSSVLHEGYIYGFDEAILACLDAATGELMWKGGRYGYGQLLLASGHLVISSEAGEVVLVKADPHQHMEIARFQAIEGKTWNVPALADGRLIVRNTAEMACFSIAGEK